MQDFWTSNSQDVSTFLGWDLKQLSVFFEMPWVLLALDFIPQLFSNAKTKQICRKFCEGPY